MRQRICFHRIANANANANARRTRGGGAPCIAGLGAALVAPMALAASMNTGNPDIDLSWDNRIGYSTAVRLKPPSAALSNSPPTTINQDDGDRDFKRGFISSRFDLFSEIDARYKDFGTRISGAAWYDAVYDEHNDNDSPATVNAVSAPSNSFTALTRRLHGHKAELLDAFVFGKTELGDLPLSFRLGRHALLWGDSLFFGNNAIAGTQASVDVIKLQSAPNSRFQEITRPDDQLSALLQLRPDLAVGAYYKLSWAANRLPAAGSYFSAGDILAGGERLITALLPDGGATAFYRGADQNARAQGQGGLELKWALSDVDIGLYALRYHDHTPQLYLRPGVGANPASGQIGTYNLVYAENIRAYGVSASSTVGATNLAAEVSTRRNADLQSDGQLAFGDAPNGSSDPLYALGNTAHAQVSWIWAMPPNALAQESGLSGEVAWNRTLKVTRNAAALNPNAARDAWGMRLVYSATYRQVMPGVDLSVPVGVSYFPKGKSSAVAGFGVDKGGDLSLGVAGSYLDVWRFALNLTHYYGPEGTFFDANAHYSYKQSLKDRDFVSLALSRAF